MSILDKASNMCHGDGSVDTPLAMVKYTRMMKMARQVRGKQVEIFMYA